MMKKAVAGEEIQRGSRSTVGTSVFSPIAAAFGTMSLCACGGVPSETHEETTESASAVIGGQESPPHAWPWHVEVRTLGDYRCGGALVDRDWVITAAHCVDFLEPSTVTIVAGSHDITVSEPTDQVRSANALFLHPQFNSPTSFSNDIALIRLASPVTLTPEVQLLRLAQGDDGPGQFGMLTGWGDILQGSTSMPQLQETRVPIKPNSSCNSAPTLFRDLNANELCAGFVDGSRGGCHGDSGSALVVVGNDGRWEHAGIVSWGAPHCSSYTVYARTTSHLAWIQSFVTSQKDVPLVGDLDGDNRHELLIWRPTTNPSIGKWFALRPDLTSFYAAGSEPVWATPTHRPLLGNLDNDNSDELVVWRPASGTWHPRRANGTPFLFPTGTSSIAHGVAGDVPFLADLDGDMSAELVVWRPSNGKWYAMRTNGTLYYAAGSEPALGGVADVPLVGDITGDFVDDLIIWQPTSGKWFAKRSNGDSIFAAGSEPAWGSMGEIPIVGDLDGDIVDDLTTFRPSDGTWNGIRRSGERIFTTSGAPRLGTRGDFPFLANVNTGSDDLLVWRPSDGRWSAKQTNGTVIFTDVAWGLPH
jgi:hypothetical protein